MNQQAKQRQVEAGEQYGENHPKEVGAQVPHALKPNKPAPRTRDKVGVTT